MQVAGKSPLVLSVVMLLLLLLLLLLLPNVLSVLLLHQLPSSSSSHSLNLTHLTSSHLHLHLSLPALSNCSTCYSTWLSCLYQLPSNPSCYSAVEFASPEEDMR